MVGNFLKVFLKMQNKFHKILTLDLIHFALLASAKIRHTKIIHIHFFVGFGEGIMGVRTLLFNRKELSQSANYCIEYGHILYSFIKHAIIWFSFILILVIRSPYNPESVPELYQRQIVCTVYRSTWEYIEPVVALVSCSSPGGLG